METIRENKKVDRRVIKTKRAIRDAFAKLLTIKNIDAITIKDIADEADVNRKTIYNYYNGIYEIQDEIENELVTRFEQVISDIDLRDEGSTSIIFDRLTAIIQHDSDFYGHLLDINVNSMLERKMVYSLKNLIKETFTRQQLFPAEKLDTIVDFIGFGMLGAYQNWFTEGKKRPIEDLAYDINILLHSGADALRKK